MQKKNSSERERELSIYPNGRELEVFIVARTYNQSYLKNGFIMITLRIPTTLCRFPSRLGVKMLAQVKLVMQWALFPVQRT